MNSKDVKGDDLQQQMTDLQFAQVFKVLMQKPEKNEVGKEDKEHLYPM